jgi:hypothetical protein
VHLVGNVVDGFLVGHRPANPFVWPVRHRRCDGRQRHASAVNVRGYIDRPLRLFRRTSTAGAANATLGA